MRLLLLSSLLICSFSLSAQFEEYVEESHEPNKQNSGPKFVFKTNPLAVLSGEIPIFASEYRGVIEYVADYKSSYTGGVSLYTMSPFLKSSLEQDSSFQNAGVTAQDFALLGFRLQLGYRLYPLAMVNKNAIDGTFPPKGLFLFGLVSYSDARLFQRANRSDQIQFSHLNITANAGYQFVFDELFTLDLYLGAGYKNNQIIEVSRTNRKVINDDMINDLFIYDSNLKINLGINIGIIF